MSRLGRRRWAIRVMLGLAAIFAVGWCLSTRYTVLLHHDNWFIEVRSGVVTAVIGSPPSNPPNPMGVPQAIVVNSALYDELAGIRGVKGIAKLDGHLHLRIWRLDGKWNARRKSMFHYSPAWGATINMPFLYLVLACIIVAAVFRFLGRRRRSGRCAKCDYDLTGNTSGICPECGLAAEMAIRPLVDQAETQKT